MNSFPSPFTHRIENPKCFNISHSTEKTHILKGMTEFILKGLYQTVFLIASVNQVSFLHNLLLTFQSENITFIFLFKEIEVSFRSIQ